MLFFSFVYACGLRLSEALAVQVSDVDSHRRMVHARRGKGAKDRFVPLPRGTLLLLRRYWVTHRNPVFLFPTPHVIQRYMGTDASRRRR